MTDSGRVDWRTLLTPGVLQTSAAEPEVRRGRTIVPPTSWRPRTISTAGHPPSSGGLVPESAVVEKDAAAKCRAYLAAAQKEFSFEDRRRDLARFTRDFYRKRLQVRSGRSLREVFDALADPDTLLIEMAHDGQLPHLGIVRLVLKSHSIARQDSDALALYLVGNHYTAAMRPENLRFGVPLKGGSPDDVKHPPRIRLGKAQAHVPFRLLGPPSAHSLFALRDQVTDFVENNLSHEAKRGHRTLPDARERIFGRLDEVFRMLVLAASEVASFGDWLIRAQYDLFHRMMGQEADRIVFLPMADVTSLLRPELTTVAARAKEVSAIKAEVAKEQLSAGIEPYTRSAREPPLWAYCLACYRRTRVPWQPGNALEMVCPFCATHVVLAAEEAWKWVMPDIIGYEAALFRLGIAGWVVGSHAPYHPVVERTYARLFGAEMPPKFFLTSVPVFRGIGDPRDGYGRTRLLRALLEMDPPAVAKGLAGPWAEDPKLRSDLLVS